MSEETELSDRMASLLKLGKWMKQVDESIAEHAKRLDAFAEYVKRNEPRNEESPRGVMANVHFRESPYSLTACGLPWADLSVSGDGGSVTCPACLAKIKDFPSDPQSILDQALKAYDFDELRIEGGDVRFLERFTTGEDEESHDEADEVRRRVRECLEEFGLTTDAVESDHDSVWGRIVRVPVASNSPPSPDSAASDPNVRAVPPKSRGQDAAEKKIGWSDCGNGKYDVTWRHDNGGESVLFRHDSFALSHHMKKFFQIMIGQQIDAEIAKVKQETREEAGIKYGKVSAKHINELFEKCDELRAVKSELDAARTACGCKPGDDLKQRIVELMDAHSRVCTKLESARAAIECPIGDDVAEAIKKKLAYVKAIARSASEWQSLASQHQRERQEADARAGDAIRQLDEAWKAVGGKGQSGTLAEAIASRLAQSRFDGCQEVEGVMVEVLRKDLQARNAAGCSVEDDLAEAIGRHKRLAVDANAELDEAWKAIDKRVEGESLGKHIAAINGLRSSAEKIKDDAMREVGSLLTEIDEAWQAVGGKEPAGTLAGAIGYLKLSRDTAKRGYDEVTKAAGNNWQELQDSRAAACAKEGQSLPDAIVSLVEQREKAARDDGKREVLGRWQDTSKYLDDHADAIVRAKAEERQACANIAFEIANRFSHGSYSWMGATHVAERLRDTPAHVAEMAKNAEQAKAEPPRQDVLKWECVGEEMWQAFNTANIGKNLRGLSVINLATYRITLLCGGEWLQSADVELGMTNGMSRTLADAKAACERHNAGEVGCLHGHS